jgi:exosortase A-associated hydrolase 2
VTSPRAGRGAGIPLFLDGSAGRLFAIHHAPETGKESRRGILYLPPFAEEMNRSRRMVALQAQALAHCGHGVLLLDPYGTGDSEGEFGQAQLANWLADIELAHDWLIGVGYSTVDLWGLRFGALLGAAAIEHSTHRFTRSVFWQPVTNGRQMMTQFLRIALASSWVGDRGRMSSESLRGQLSKGCSVDVGGYELSPELVTAIEGMSLSASTPANLEALYWFEVGPDSSDQLLPSSRNIVDAWCGAGCNLIVRKLVGPQFWSTSEITVAPDLLDATSTAFTPL